MRMARSARPGASRAVVIGSPSTRATRGMWPTSLPLLRLLPRPHPGLFPLAGSQARPGMPFLLRAAGSPRIHCLRDRRHTGPPARQRAGAPDRSRLSGQERPVANGPTVYLVRVLFLGLAHTPLQYSVQPRAAREGLEPGDAYNAVFTTSNICAPSVRPTS